MSYAPKYDSDLLTTAPVVKSIGFWEKVMLPIFKMPQDRDVEHRS
jgi:hypothetical protein